MANRELLYVLGFSLCSNNKFKGGFISRKAKITITLGILLILVSATTILGLAKTGKLALLADVIKPKTTGDLGTITIQVRDQNHQKLPYEVVVIKRNQSDGSVSDPKNTLNGDVTFNNLPVGDYEFLAIRDNNCQNSKTTHIIAGQNPNLEIILNCTGTTQQTFSVFGTVTDNTGAKLPGVNATLIIDNGVSISATSSSSANGLYLITSIPIVSGQYATNYKIKYEKTGHQTQTKSFIDLSIPPTGWPLVAGSNYSAGIVVLSPIQTTTTLYFTIKNKNYGCNLAGISVIMYEKNIEKISNTNPAPQSNGSFTNVEYGVYTFKINFSTSSYYNDLYEKNYMIGYSVDQSHNQLVVELNSEKQFTIAGKITNSADGQFISGIPVFIREEHKPRADIEMSTIVSSGQADWPQNQPIYNYHDSGTALTNHSFIVYIPHISYEPYQETSPVIISLANGKIQKRADGTYFAEVNFALTLAPYNPQNSMTIRIKDSQTQNPISGATVDLSSIYPVNHVNKTTNSAGEIVFYRVTWISIVEAIGTQAQISAENYISKLIMGLPDDKFLPVWTIVLDRKQGTDTGILGRVIDLENQSNLGGATVILYKDQPNVNAIKATSTTTKDPIGRFSFSNLSPGNYIVSTFKNGYLATDKSRAQILNLARNEQVQVILYLKKSLIENLIEYPVLVLQANTFASVQGIRVTLNAPQDGLMAKDTDANGRVLFLIHPGQRINIKIQFTNSAGQNVTTEKNINIPANIESLSEVEVYQIYSYGIFIINKYPPDSSKIATLKIVVKNEQGEKLKNIEVKISNKQSGEDLTAKYGGEKLLTILPGFFTLRTNQNGEVNLPSDLASFLNGVILSDNLKNALINNFKYYLDSKIGQIQINMPEEQGYNSYSIDNYTIKSYYDTLEITLRKKDDGYIGVRVSDLLQNFDISSYPDKNALITIQQKQANGSFKNINIDQKDISFLSDKSGITVKYWNLPANYYYRAVFNPANLISEEKYYNGQNTIILRFQYCSGDPTLKVPMDDDLYFILGNQEIKNWFDVNLDFFRQLAQQIRVLRHQSKDIGNLAIVIKEDRFNAQAHILSEPADCFGVRNLRFIIFYKPYFDFLISHKDFYEIFATITHEYGHQVYQKFFLEQNNLFYKRWEALFAYLKNQTFQDCVWSQMQDGNVGVVPWAIGGHPWCDYGLTQDGRAHEMFASFFSGYFAYHDRFHYIIRDLAPNNSYCQNVLKYMWELFAENVGKVYSNDHLMFKPVGGKIGNATYTFEQIKRGQWLESNFNNLSLLQKAMIQINRIIGPVLNAVRWGEVQEKINAFNNWLDEQLRKLGLWDKTGTITGYLKDQSGNAVANTFIQIGPRTTRTRANGAFTVLRIPEGSQQIIRIQFKNTTYAIIQPPDKQIIVPKGETTNIDIVVIR